MLQLILLLCTGVCILGGTAIVYLTSGHDVAAFLLILSSAVLLVGACLIHAIDALRQDLVTRRWPD